MRFTSLADAAKAYAEVGLKIFPVKPQTKEPLTKNGFWDATNDREQIVTWWTQFPDANIGLSCKASGIVVIDLDRHEGKADGLDAFYQLMGAHPMPDCPMVKTGGGGLHLFFKHPAGLLKGKIQEGIDIKTSGYVVLPPSFHPNGSLYEWEGDPRDILAALSVIPPLPEWLLVYCQKTQVVELCTDPGSTDYPPSSAETIQERCSFIRYWVDNAEKLSEPDWYQGIGVLAYTENADDFIHRYSSRYSGYSPTETQEKINHWRKDGHSPASCETIQAQCGEEHCQSCPFKGHIKSPIQLGIKSQNRPHEGKPMPFPIDVLPGVFRDFTVAASEAIHCPPDYVACSLIGMASTLIGASRKVQIDREWVTGQFVHRSGGASR